MKHLFRYQGKLISLSGNILRALCFMNGTKKSGSFQKSSKARPFINSKHYLRPEKQNLRATWHITESRIYDTSPQLCKVEDVVSEQSAILSLRV